MTTPNPGAALADSMTELRDWLRADGRNASGVGWRAFNQIEAALATYRASQVEGERVRIAVAADGKEWCAYGSDSAVDPMVRAVSLLGNWADNPQPLCFIEATLPPRTTPPVVEGTVCE